jgi:predicted transcriptional regulator
MATLLFHDLLRVPIARTIEKPVAEIGECGTISRMTAKILRDVLERAENWPEAAQEELAELALEIDARLAGGVYHATAEELAGIDRGLRAAREGRIASEEDVEAVFARHRRT